MLYEEVFKKLNRHNVKYVVAGGIAAVLHGVVRFTSDLDIIIDMTAENIDRFFSALQGLGYTPKIPVTKNDFKDRDKRQEWIKKKHMKVFSFVNLKDPLKVVDVFVDDKMNYDEMGRVYVRPKGLNIPIVSIKDLKKLKRKAARPEDFADINALNEIERIKRLAKKR